MALGPLIPVAAAGSDTTPSFPSSTSSSSSTATVTDLVTLNTAAQSEVVQDVFMALVRPSTVEIWSRQVMHRRSDDSFGNGNADADAVKDNDQGDQQDRSWQWEWHWHFWKRFDRATGQP